MIKLSASSVKKFRGSRSKRCGHYILNEKDTFTNDSFIVGQAFENWLMMGDEKLEEVVKKNGKPQDLEKIVSDLDTLKHNAEGLDFTPGLAQVKVEGKLLGQDWIGYIDNLNGDVIEDIKTCKTLTNLEKPSINMWSNMSNMEEYKLQMWLYMKLTGKNKSRIIEVAKHKYKDGRHAHQIIEINITEEFDSAMTKIYTPIVADMAGLYKKYKTVLDKFA